MNRNLIIGLVLILGIITAVLCSSSVSALNGTMNVMNYTNSIALNDNSNLTANDGSSITTWCSGMACEVIHQGSFPYFNTTGAEGTYLVNFFVNYTNELGNAWGGVTHIYACNKTALQFFGDTSGCPTALRVGSSYDDSNKAQRMVIGIITTTTTYPYIKIFTQPSVGIGYFFNYDYAYAMFSPFIIIDTSAIYNQNVYETSNQNFILNLTFDSNPTSITGIFNYNGTNYTSTTSCNSGNCLISNNINIPTVTLQSNKSFYWIVDYYNNLNRTTYNSTIYNQTINQINITNCTSGTIALNFSAMDETTQTTINLFNFSASFNYWLGTGSVFKNFNITNLNIGSQAICLSHNVTYYTTANIQYSATGYNQRDYFLVNASISNQTNNIILYLLDSTGSTSFIDEVLDTGRNPIADAYIYIQRCYPGNCVNVQVIKTDNNGRSIGFYKTETVDYKHIIMKDGSIIYTDEPHKIFATTVPYTNTFYINYGEEINFNYTLNNLYESLTYNNQTNLVTYTYIDSSGLFQQGRLLVELFNYSGKNRVICNTTSTQSSATITCDMSTSPESNYEASGFIKRTSEKLVDFITFSLGNAKQVFGLAGLFLGFLIILTAGMAFLYHPLAGTWMVTMAMVFTNIVGFTSFTPIWIFGSIILSLIFTWFFRE